MDSDDDGKLRWCWLQHGNAALMLQEFRKEGPQCLDAGRQSGRGRIHLLHHARTRWPSTSEITARGIAATRPFVGNGMWVTSVQDPDGYKLEFESLYRRAGRNGVFGTADSQPSGRSPNVKQVCEGTCARAA